VLCDGYAFCEYCVPNEADCCVVATVPMCLPVVAAHLTRHGRLVGLGCVGAECNGCPRYFLSAWMRTGVAGIRSAVGSEYDSHEAYAVVGYLRVGSRMLRVRSAGSYEQTVTWL